MRNLVLSLLAVALLAPAARAATWSEPHDVSSASSFVARPFVGFGASGEGLAAWRWTQGAGSTAFGGVRLATLGLDGSVAAERDGPDAELPPALFAANSVALLAEARDGGTARLRVWLGTLAGGLLRTWSSPVFRPFGAPALAANERGDVAVAYLRVRRGGRRQVVLAERRPGRVFSGPALVAGRGHADAVSLAMSPRGDLVVAWERDGQVFARIRRGEEGRLSHVRRLGRGARLHTRLRTAVARDGRAWVAWSSQRRDEGGGHGAWVLRIASAEAGGAFVRARTLERFRALASEEGGIHLGLDPDGNAFVAWSGWDGGHFRARLAFLDGLDGSLSRIGTASAPGYDAVVTDLATSREVGEALLVWVRLDPVSELGTQVIAAHRRPEGGTEGEEVISADDRAREAAAAYDPRTGRPTVVWSQRVGPDGPGVAVDDVRTVVRASRREP